jgi:hypothetical protein
MSHIVVSRSSEGNFVNLPDREASVMRYKAVLLYNIRVACLTVFS